MSRNTLSATIYILLVCDVIIGRVSPFTFGRELGLALTIAFLALEIGRAPKLQRYVGAALFMLGGVAAWAGGRPIDGVLDGLYRAQIFLVMFFGVMWLREPAVTSPSLRNLRDWVVRQPAGRRYPILWLSAHYLGSVLNLAAMSLLSVMVQEQKEHRMRRRLSIALMLGFTSASTWGPFYVSISVILTAIPGVRWIDIAPQGLALSVFILAVGWAYDRVFLRQQPTGSRPDVPEIGARTILRTIGILCVLIVLVMGVHEVLGFPIPIALGVIGPPFAIGWAAIQASKPKGPIAGARTLIVRIFKNLPELRNEAVAFSAASVLGVGVAAVLPPDEIRLALLTYGISGDVVVIGLVFGMMLGGLAGFHPVILAILVGEVMPPEVIGLPPEILAMALLGVWGTTTMISPFSATTLFMSRVAGVPSHIIAWRWDIPVVLLASVTVAVYVVTLKHLFYS